MIKKVLLFHRSVAVQPLASVLEYRTHTEYSVTVEMVPAAAEYDRTSIASEATPFGTVMRVIRGTKLTRQGRPRIFRIISKTCNKAFIVVV